MEGNNHFVPSTVPAMPDRPTADRPLIHVKRANTILYCRKWPQTVHFYREELGLAVHHATSWFVEFHLGGNAFLSIADAARATVGCAVGQGITLSWQVADVTVLHRRMTARAIAVGPLQAKWGARVFYFHDPEGHRLEAWSI